MYAVQPSPAMVTPVDNGPSLVMGPIGNGLVGHISSAANAAALQHNNDQGIVGLVVSKPEDSPARLESGLLLPLVNTR